RSIVLQNIFVITHTESVHHVEQLGGGWYDTPLTEKGKTDAHRVARSLSAQVQADALSIFSSDLKRCTDMAAIFQEVFGCTYKADPRLREMSCGSAEGMSRQWQDMHINPVPANNNRLDHRVFEGAESRREVGARITRFIEDELAGIDHTAIVITHGFALTFFIAAWLRIPVEHMDYCEFRSTPGGVTHLSQDTLFRNRSLVGLNATSYLKK
ncbi:MAG: histidine phosphatase family protein, partial [Bacteroidota bacterium]